IKLKKVVLPAPFGPMMALICPAGKVAVTWLTAVKPPYCLVKPLASSMVLGLRLDGVGRLGQPGCTSLCLFACTSLQIRTDDAVRHENEEHDQQRTEHHHAIVLQ